MPPRWIRQTGFFAALVLGALVVASVARPDACASVWTVSHRVSGCCALSSYTRWTGPRGDCCDYGALEDRDPGASTASIAVPASPFVRTAAPSVRIAPPAARWLQSSARIPERPPDRAATTVVLLI